MANDDMELVRQFVTSQSESAFTALVSRYTNLIYSAAFRRVGNSQLAEEITQAVFTILAQKAYTLNKKTVLPGWLYQAACYVSGHAIKQELRRQRREQEAYMQALSNQAEPEVWSQITPLLEDAMMQLGQAERDALVLRFFEGHSLKEVGNALGTSEAATKMRVKRALEKLRIYFSRHGVNSTTETIAGAMSANSIMPAPPTLAKTAAAVAIGKGATASTSTLTLIKGAIKIMAWTKAKTAIFVSTAAILAVSTATTLIVSLNHHRATAQTDFPRSSWNNIGYADPVSAFETAFWATSQSDGKTIWASLAPDLQQKLGQGLKRAGIVPEDYLSQSRNSADHLNGITGFQIIRSEVISEDEVRLHLTIKGKQGEQTFTMKKIGDEWKMDDFPSGF